MNEIKIQQNFPSFNVSGVKKSSENIYTDFKSLLNENLSEIPADFENYKSGIIFGPDLHFCFPPDTAPTYFKKAWYDVTSKMDETQRICIFNDYICEAIRYGYYFSMDDYFDRNISGGDAYNTMNNRVKNLGCVGCLEIAIRSTEQCYNDNVLGGNEKRFTDKMKQALDNMKEIMQKCLESDDFSLDRQIRMADTDFFQSRQKVWREADIWLKQQGGTDIATMSDEKFDTLMKRFVPTFTKHLPDGTIITMNAETNKIINISKERDFDLLQAI